ncbi:tetratricopeptide repeat protein, partial [Acinetobacter sp.]|uniref:tetratricopeptide repeat protein n=1 Tax=Acinetobacter sp. TaxID=472 RepID=UPI00305E3AD9
MKLIPKLLAAALSSIILLSVSVHATEPVKSNDVSALDIKYPVNKEKLAKAVENNDAKAQHFLGSLYFSGKGGYDQDYKKAFEWYEKSAKNGFSKAQVALADMYLNGFGTKPNAA